MPTPRQSARQLAEIIEEPERALILPRYWKEPLCRRWFDYVDEQVHIDCAEARKLALIGVRLALRVSLAHRRRGLRGDGVLARAYAVLGSAYRAGGDLASAARVLQKATRLVKLCTAPDDRSDISGRHAILHIYKALRPDGTSDGELLSEGLALAEAAIREARSPLAEARAFNAHGNLALCAGDPLTGAKDARRALALLDPNERPYDHASATSILVWALSQGSAADREEGIGYLQRLREALPQRTPAIRARLLWAEALLYVPNRRKKARARRLLDQARRTFLRLGMRAEAIGATADLARIDPAGAVPRLCSDLLALLDPGPVRELVGKLSASRIIERVELIDQLRTAIQGPGLLPAAAWPAP